MSFRFSRSAVCRSFAAFRAATIAPFLAGAMLCSLVPQAIAHEGHDHSDAPAMVPMVGGLPRLSTSSEAYELVAVLDGGRLTIYLDRFEDNAPLTDAMIVVSIDGEAVAAEPATDNTYVLTSGLFSGKSSVELVFDIKASEADDLLIGTLVLPAKSTTGTGSDSRSWLGRIWTALRHGIDDHLALLGFALFVGAALGLAIRHRVFRATVILLVAIPLMGRIADAHAGHHDAEDATALVAPGDTARRLPGGQVFVPKPMQRVLDVRTVIAKPQTVAKSTVLVGRVITNPNRSGVVQSINGGRIIAPEPGLPRLGQTVSKGDVLASIEPAMPVADRTTISERSGELEQMIAVAEAKLRRLRPLADRGVTPQSQIADAETELEGLYRRRDVIRETRIAPEVLRAPIDGVIASSRVVSGQVVQAQDMLFQIVDPMSLWVEAFNYGEIDPATLKHATAAGTGSRPMKLSFQGWSRALQQQATIVQFAIVDPPETIRVGQPVTVTAQQSDSVSGTIISRDAVVRGSNGEAIVWSHIGPEQFEARPVRTEPFDAASVLVAAGVTHGERIVVRGAELINQIR